MGSFIAWIKQLVGNKSTWAKIGIGAFIIVLSVAFCAKARGAEAGEIDLRIGTSFGKEGTGPVLGLQVKAPLPQFQHVNFYAGTLLWGSTHYAQNPYYSGDLVPNNWDWHAGIQGCRERFCASLGAAYVQRIDVINGAHTNFYLELSYLIGWKRVSSIDVTHLSDAGTSDPNIGRQAALISIRLQ